MYILKVSPKKVSKSDRTANFSLEEYLLLAESGSLSPDTENKACDSKTLTKSAKAREKIEKKIELPKSKWEETGHKSNPKDTGDSCDHIQRKETIRNAVPLC